MSKSGRRRAMPSELINSLINKRARVTEESRGFLDKFEVQSRTWDAEDELKWKHYNEEIDELTSRIGELEENEARKKDLDKQREQFEAVVRTKDPEPVDSEKELEQRVRQFFRGGLPGADYAPKSIEFKITDDIKRSVHEQRDLVKGTTTLGGFTVPTGFIARLYEQLVEVSSVRQSGAIIYTTDSGENLLVPKATAHGSAALLAEAAPIVETDATFAQQTLNAYKYAWFSEVSNELITDTAIDLLGYLARAAGRNLGLATGVHFVTGTGTGQPEGIQTNVTTGKQGLAGQTLTVIADDLFDVYHSIVTQYRSNGVWMMNDASLAKVRKLKDTTNQYLWQPGLQQGIPDSLLGRPVLTDPTIPVMGISVKSILFGDFSAYYAIRDVSGVRFERSDDFRFQNDLVAFRAIIRSDGKPMDTTAVKAYQNSAT
jgi:HK97 family phage major capsid protein